VEVAFALDEEDLVALARQHMLHSPALRRRYRIRWLGATLLMGAAAVFLFVHLSLKFPALYLGAFALFFLVLYPYYDRWLVGRTLRHIVSARLHPKALAPRRLRATPEGLEVEVGGSKTFTAWSRVSGIEVTPERTFVAIDGAYSIVIPRRRLGEEIHRRFIDTLLKKGTFIFILL